LVELPHAGNVRMVGNLLGDPLQEVRIGAEVVGAYEHRAEASSACSLLQWRLR
ncbi:MAG: DNA-binding protein, partial [Burkholderiales bacterium]